jgi:seryl-tRNA synthetase
VIVINPDFIRDNPKIVKDSHIARGEIPDLVDDFLKSDQHWRNLTIEVDNFRAEQKTLSKTIGALKVQEKNNPSAEVKKQLEELTVTGTNLSKKIDELIQQQEEARNSAQKAMNALSNIVQKEAPVGDEKDYKVLEIIGKPRDFNQEGLTVKDHVEIGTDLNLIDIERGAKVSGSRFYYLVNDGALLELALVNFAIDIAQQHGFKPVIPPALVKPQAMEGTGFLGQAAENVYRI